MFGMSFSASAVLTHTQKQTQLLHWDYPRIVLGLSREFLEIVFIFSAPGVTYHHETQWISTSKNFNFQKPGDHPFQGKTLSE